MALYRKEFQVSHSKVKMGLSREIHTLSTECRPSQKVRGGPRACGPLGKLDQTPGVGVVSFYGLGNFIGY